MTDADIDIISDFCDVLMRRGMWKELDAIVSVKALWYEYSVNAVVILTATLPAKTKIPSRQELLDHAKGKWGEGLFKGL